MCNVAGCGRVDFVMSMYSCHTCRGPYCEEHRTKPAHSCCSSAREGKAVGGEDEERERSRLRDVFASVERRFDDEQEQSSTIAPRTHFKAVVTPNEEALSAQADKDSLFTAKLEGIRRTANSSSATEKNKRIAEKTAETLIKLKAQGPASIPSEKRIYFTAKFSSSGCKLILFFSNESSLSSMLAYVAKTHPFETFASPVAKEGRSLVVSSELHPEWTDVHWDRRRALIEAISNFDEVVLDTVPTLVVVGRQNEIEAHVRSEIATVGSISSEEVLVPATATSFNKGQRVLYKKDPSDEPLPSTIIGVHHDDFPNIYYTVSFQLIMMHLVSTVSSLYFCAFRFE